MLSYVLDRKTDAFSLLPLKADMKAENCSEFIILSIVLQIPDEYMDWIDSIVIS